MGGRRRIEKGKGVERHASGRTRTAIGVLILNFDHHNTLPDVGLTNLANDNIGLLKSLYKDTILRIC